MHWLFSRLLDGDNCVDMLKPGMPASKVLQMGDRVLLWNGIEMVDSFGARRLLKDVVVRAEAHTLVIEREQSSLREQLQDETVRADAAETQAAEDADRRLDELRLRPLLSSMRVACSGALRPSPRGERSCSPLSSRTA